MVKPHINWRISIHTLRVEGDRQEEKRRALTAISIHTLRVEGDGMMTSRCCLARADFNPHPPRGG